MLVFRLDIAGPAMLRPGYQSRNIVTKLIFGLLFSGAL